MGGGRGWAQFYTWEVSRKHKTNTWNRERDMKNRRKMATTGSLHGTPMITGLANGEISTLLKMDLTLAMLRIPLIEMS